MCCISKAFGRYNPLDVDRKNKRMVKAPNAITDRFNLLYIESPVGSGYSVATKETMVPSYKVLGENAIEVFRAVMEVHQPLKNAKWFFNGESFCGLQLPTIASAFIDAFPGQYKGAVLETCVLGPEQVSGYDYQMQILDDHKVWNGCCHRCYCNYCMCYGLCCMKMGVIDFATFENYWFLPFLWPCGKMTRTESEYDEDCEQWVQKTHMRFAPTNLSHHDACDDALECRTDIGWFVRSKVFANAIGAKKEVKEISDDSFVNIMSKDPKYTSAPCINKMLAVEDSTLLILTGSGDLIVPTPGIEAVVNKLDVAQKSGFAGNTWTKAEDHEWKKSANLEMRKVYGVGHLIFVDDPALHERMVVEYLDGAM